MSEDQDHMEIDIQPGTDEASEQKTEHVLESSIEHKEQTSKTKPTKQKFEVKKWTAVAFWSWDIQVENCAICRNHLMEPCIECQPNTINNTQEDCIAAWGACNHAFHMHCIQRWLKSRNVCPLDNREWTFQKFGN